MDLINSVAQYGLLHGTLSRETHVYKSRMKSKRFTNESKIFTATIFRDETENVPSPQPSCPPCQDPLTFGNLLSTELKAQTQWNCAGNGEHVWKVYPLQICGHFHSRWCDVHTKQALTHSVASLILNRTKAWMWHLINFVPTLKIISILT